MNEYFVFAGLLSVALVLVLLVSARHVGLPQRAPKPGPTLLIGKAPLPPSGLRSALIAGLRSDEAASPISLSQPAASPSRSGERSDPPLRSPTAGTRSYAEAEKDARRINSFLCPGPEPLADPTADRMAPHLSGRPRPPTFPLSFEPEPRPMRRLFSRPMPDAPLAPPPAPPKARAEDAEFADAAPGAPRAAPDATPLSEPPGDAAASLSPPAETPLEPSSPARAEAPQTGEDLAKADSTATAQSASPGPAAEANVQYRDYSADPDETIVIEDFDPIHDVVLLPAQPMLAEYVQAGYLLTFEDGQNLLLAGLVEGRHPPPHWEVQPPEPGAASSQV